MIQIDFIKRAHLHYMVRKYLSAASTEDVVDVVGVEVVCTAVDLRCDADRRYRYVARSPAGWRVTIEVQADAETYMARIVRPRPGDVATETAITAWLRQAAER